MIVRPATPDDVAVLVLPSIDREAAKRADDILRRRASADGLPPASRPSRLAINCCDCMSCVMKRL